MHTKAVSKPNNDENAVTLNENNKTTEMRIRKIILKIILKR